MATKKKPRASAEPAAVTDPTAPVDSPMLLKAAQPVLKLLEADLTARAKASPAVTLALTARHQQERDARRTADAFPQWLEHFVEQVAAAWLLSCVFVRTLEDRSLLGQNRIAGPGALDSQRLFLELAPSLSERDYLLFVFRELTRLPAAKALFDARHNPVWMLAPSAEAAKSLLQLFRSPNAETPALRFGQPDTRVLGDLYQDLNANVRKRFALLQTPNFVEAFILDRTLEPAIQKFGLEATDLIDPTCGSGHFLLGAFERLYDHQLREQPGLSPREAARLALDKVYGADINPYAVAVARFRLTLAYLEKAGFQKLGDAPELPLHVVVADSLLHNPQLRQGSLMDVDGLTAEDRAGFGGREFRLEDPEAAREVLTRKYAAVVGNPPYITVQDAVLRERYREMYPSAAGKYAVSVPFTERFFHLGRAGARVGMITANSFMKREFGKKLIEAFLPTVNLDLIVNTSGAYIPGHGTPTVLLFGSAEEPQASEVLAVLAKRGEPATPADPEQGLVWRSIVERYATVGFENDYVSVAEVPRAELAAHPWSLAGGGAGDVKSLIEERADRRLGDLTTAIGFDAILGEDDLFVGEASWVSRLGAPQEFCRLLGVGEGIRDWAITCSGSAIFPYSDSLIPVIPKGQVERHFWRFRTNLIERRQFGKNTIEAGLRWFEYRSFYKAKRSTPLSITFAFVATHNHFVLDRGGKIFKQSAPIIKLPESASEDDHLALLAYLNSSAACFWMKQVMMNKGATSDRGVLQADEDKFRFEFDGTKMKTVPLAPDRDRQILVQLARRLAELQSHGTQAAYIEALESGGDIAGNWKSIEEDAGAARRLSVALQEEIDWRVYGAFGLLGDDEPYLHPDAILKGYDADQRPFKLVESAVESSDSIVRRRVALIRSNDAIAVLESSEFKRRWFRSLGKFNAGDVNASTLQSEALASFIADLMEREVRRASLPLRWSTLVGALREREPVIEKAYQLCAGIDGDWVAYAEGRACEEAVAYLAALRFTDAGLTKHAQWQHTWDLQRQEDAGVKLSAPIPVPPKYDQKDFRDGRYWSLRGKLDVPKERFIAYPGCESDEDGEPVFGWAGWDHLQRAQALVGLYNDRKGREGWEKERLVPMLAGLLELIPWLKQWHNEASAEFDGLRMGDSYEAFLDGECRGLGVTREVLVGWRPAR